MLSLVCVVAGIFTADIVSATEWTYGDQANWSPNICVEGPHQSPIPLATSRAEEVYFSPFTLYGYGQSMTMVIQNNGHSVKVTPNNPRQLPEIHGGGLSETYVFDHLHFHWQSEHTMEDERFALEMHMVHYAQKYGSMEEASKHAPEGGLAVFAVFFYLSPDDFQEFDPLIDVVIDIQDHINKEKELDGFVIKHFMPMDLAGFYRYNGSLTTPGCSEGIIWTVFLHTLPISQLQVENFQAIRTMDNTPLKKNFRELQALNNRHILLKISPVRSFTNNANSFTKTNTYLFLFINLLCYFYC